ncbi:MAG: hypothetical protein GX879_11240 [Bacteroidales bacterium]|nr:hypothetical protein [Bacteroidales bacterium]
MWIVRIFSVKNLCAINFKILFLEVYKNLFMKKCLFLILLTFLIVSCSKEKESVKLSGLLWGGQGNRITIELISDTTSLKDTLLINHKGELYWHPDTFIRGIYKLSKNENEDFIMFMDNNIDYNIDGQYYSFSEQIVINEDELISSGFKRINHFSKEWQKLNKIVASSIEKQKNSITKKEIDSLHIYVDSLDAVYRAIIYDKNDHPLEQMFSLLQHIDDKYLFDIVVDSTLFFNVAKGLKHYKEIWTVKKYYQKIDSLRYFVELKNRTALRKKYNIDFIKDTLLKKDIENQIVYFEFYEPNNHQNEHLQKIRQFGKYYQKDIKFAFISLVELDKANYYNKNFCFYYPAIQEIEGLNDVMLLIKKPTNLILNNTGEIVAKDVWGEELNNVLDELLKNKVSL